MVIFTKIEKEVNDLQYIGKIDREKFKDISEKIITDEVILTEKQREHIKARHPEILKEYERYFSQIIEYPDYILKDNIRANTALILKTLKLGENGKSVNLVLRLAVEGEDENNKNSIITCIPIGKNRLKSYKNNGKIIYKYE